jgi:hypothetical protein
MVEYILYGAVYVLFTPNLMPKYENGWNFTSDSLTHSHDVIRKQTHTKAVTASVAGSRQKQAQKLVRRTGRSLVDM